MRPIGFWTMAVQRQQERGREQGKKKEKGGGEEKGGWKKTGGGERDQRQSDEVRTTDIREVAEILAESRLMFRHAERKRGTFNPEAEERC